MRPCFRFSSWQFVFLVQHTPFEYSSVKPSLLINRTVLECLVVDSVDDRDRHNVAELIMEKNSYQFLSPVNLCYVYVIDYII